MRKMRKFEIGGMASDDDALEAKYKAAGLAASNAENKKSSGFFGRLGEGNIDEKGSEAYNKYGAGYGRKLEAENDRLKAATLRDTAAPVRIHKMADPAASAPAPAAAAKYRGSSDYSDTADMKRNQGSAAATSAKPAAAATVTKVVEDMPKIRPAGGAQVATGDARVAEYANAFPSSDMKRNQGSAAAKPPAAAAKPPAAAAKTTSPTRRDGREEDKAVPKAPADSRTAEAGNSRGSRAAEPADSRQAEAGNSRGSRPAAAKTPAAPAAKAPEAAKPAAKQLSQAQQRAQAAVARATGNSSGSASSSRVPTPEEAGRNIVSVAGKAGNILSRITDSFKKEKYKEKTKGEAVKSYASGGSVSASRRGDGIAQRGKTRGKMC